jgi:hypothetical protein
MADPREEGKPKRLLDHQTGDALMRRVWKAEEEMDLLLAHLRAIVANPDDNWTGWRHALEMLIPDSPPRIAELKAELRAKGLGPLADQMEWLCTEGEEPDG